MQNNSGCRAKVCSKSAATGRSPGQGLPLDELLLTALRQGDLKPQNLICRLPQQSLTQRISFVVLFQNLDRVRSAQIPRITDSGSTYAVGVGGAKQPDKDGTFALAAKLKASANVEASLIFYGWLRKPCRPVDLSAVDVI